MRREVLPPRLRPAIALSLLMLASACEVTLLASCQALAERHHADNTILEPVSVSPVNPGVPLIYWSIDSLNTCNPYWLRPALFCQLGTLQFNNCEWSCGEMEPRQ